ncbi:MAG: GDSL-type esterase/lipase family protein [Verrucomicrobiota bacterium]|jgi:lysophospholipase L1-like esterase|nr:GDSL-type esterase/lipase family protein [Verrucomicrobiota bacterium]HCF95096.1 sialate O-acetylesterase [Verrucomicrobiota bacterium]
MKSLKWMGWVGTFALVSLMWGCASTDQPLEVARYDHVIRVACVGDSITFGDGIEERGTNSYPAQLGALLGDDFDVRNFGVSGATLLKKGDLPYWDVDAFRAVQAFEPDIIIIKLGTNDTKPQNWEFADEFVNDYAALIDLFQSLPSSPRIWLCNPVPVYEERWGIREEILVQEVMPKIAEVAKAKGLPVIDMYTALSGMPDAFPDKIHPNADGAGIMAKTVVQTLLPSR